MWTLEVFKARAFRLALGFALTISVATAAAFAFIYLQVSRADMAQVGAILVDEASKSVDESEADLRRALELRLTRDIRRLDFVALIDPKGELIFGNVPFLPQIPIDAKAHFIDEDVFPDPHGDKDPAIFVARRRMDGGVLLLGRSLREDLRSAGDFAAGARDRAPSYDSLDPWRSAFGLHIAPRNDFKRVHDAIVRIMNGDLDLRLPFAGEDDIGKIARAVNLMLDEIARLLNHLKSAGDNIAHDLRTPLAVARAKLERALDNESGTEQLREALEAALVQIEKVSMTISAILRISAVEQGAREKQFKDFDLAAVCAQLLDFYEPLAELKGRDNDCGRRNASPGSRRPGPHARSPLEPDRQRDQVHARRRRGPHRGPDGRRAAVCARERHGRRRPPAGAGKDIRPFLSRRAAAAKRRDTGSASASPRPSPICMASN